MVPREKISGNVGRGNHAPISSATATKRKPGATLPRNHNELRLESFSFSYSYSFSLPFSGPNRTKNEKEYEKENDKFQAARKHP